MKFAELIDELSKRFVIGHVKISENTEINKIQLRSTNLTEPDGSTLYIGKTNASGGPLVLGNYLKDHSNTAVVLCPCQVNQSDSVLANEPLIQVFNEANTILESSQNQTNLITKLAMSAVTDDLQTSIDRAAATVQNSLLVIDPNYQVLIHSTIYGFKDPLWSQIIKQGYVTYDFIKAVKKIVAQQSDTTKAVYNVPCPKSPFHRKVTNLYNNGKLYGFLLMFDDHSVYNSEKTQLLPQIGQILTGELVRNHISASADSNRDRLLSMLLTEQQSQNFENVFAAQHLRLPYSMVVLTLRSQKQQPLESTKRQLKQYLLQQYPASLSTIFRHYCLAMVPLDLTEYHSSEFKKFVHRTAEELNCQIFISTFYTQPSDTSAAYEVCRRTMKLTTSTDPVIYCEDEYFDLMLSRINHDAILPFFIDPSISSLQDYDEEHDTELLPTLLNYLEQDGNLAHTSDALFIHRNTLHNRLNRIKEITAVDLKDANTRFKLMCSFKIKEYVH
ncbi:PucR family transcriptional regulator [Companilactobacillus sp.]|jgi:sugar diacid utilization regulator|uniref:PucR family transcriptional regulator n=1 Tax=Companilactobacillus sp. TaxID=2767905 RepID=UPI0025BD6225|nr:helix-turn-helix domain-containing protein [Companilactobacillus sp.]MCH4009315.1 helix-turn-helix domain-containing protein [Companilactobacillus sp.]MCH4050506.1 helix-turn-helix domain-containing protein [Companilactobacillus sp.]MCH4077257.1 helix-turn-helix domain-containing protein [Companilactobacillus sp.]MCH4125833.1 helix-turn-helix domain-containing protein [Companilactobacillus sp.]MCI1311542.1 helix-turn-helix domain-containing protein [Companilactobacillus sp.]